MKSVNSMNSLDAVKQDVTMPMNVLRRRALFLGSANALDYAVQFLLPVMLARTLEAEAFGEYRLLWLVVMSVMAVAPLAMPQSLHYFLPRADAMARRLYVHQTIIYLACAGLIGALVISPWNPYQPASMHAFSQYGAGFLVPCLAALWVTSCLLDLLPTIEERVVWQAGITISLSLLRALTLAVAAWLTGDLRALIWLLAGFALLKLLLLVGYVGRMQGLSGPWLQRKSFVEQFRHAAPFGFSGALYALRGQADQWVALTLFSLVSFAAFSIAAVLGPLVNLFRLSVNHVFMPSMSKLQASGDIAGMIDLNSRANVMVAALLYPFLAFAFVFTEELVSLVYTATYLEAAPAMRVYILSLAALVVELAGITLLLREGLFAFRLNLLILAGSIMVSWFAAQHSGLAGAAAGSVLAIYVDRFATLKRIAKRTGIALSRLQNWRVLAQLMLFSVLAASIAWWVTVHSIQLSGMLARLMLGGAVLAAAYGAMVMLFGLGRSWLIAAFNPKG
jgi:O-antigen/teichoic acid export membrane protein